jgi:hypothetical protein
VTRNFGLKRKPACQVRFSTRQGNLLGIVLLGAAALLILAGGGAVFEVIQIALRLG